MAVADPLPFGPLDASWPPALIPIISGSAFLPKSSRRTITGCSACGCFESDPEVIEAASDQRMAHLRTYQTGQYSALSQKLLNEVAGAKVRLLSPEKRAPYDDRSSLPPRTRTSNAVPAAAITLPLLASGRPFAAPAGLDPAFSIWSGWVFRVMGAELGRSGGRGSGQGSGARAYREVASPGHEVRPRGGLAAKPGHRYRSSPPWPHVTVLLGLVMVLDRYMSTSQADRRGFAQRGPLIFRLADQGKPVVNSG